MHALIVGFYVVGDPSGGAEPIPAISCIKEIQTQENVCLFNGIRTPPKNDNLSLLERGTDS